MGQPHNENDKHGVRAETPADRAKERADNKSRGEVAKTGFEGLNEQQVKEKRALERLRNNGHPTGTMNEFGAPEIPGLIKGRQPDDKEAAFKEAGYGDANLLQGKARPQETPPHESLQHARTERLKEVEANYHRDIAGQIKDAIKPASLESTSERRVPRHGQTISLKQLLNDYKTPFVDAYEHSKHLKDGEPGKSQTLESVVDRLKDCPWADQIRIKFDSKADNPDYIDSSSIITIRPKDSPGRQTEIFAHEAYHATHQFLSKLYDNGIVSKPDFVDTWMKGEVKAMLTEAKVHDELGQTKEPTRFDYYPHGKENPKDFIEISQYVKEHGEHGLQEFLGKAEPFGKNARPYEQHYADFYEKYTQNFKLNEAVVNKHLQNWVQTGHSRDDI